MSVKIKPAYWVIDRNYITKIKKEADAWKNLGYHVYPVYDGWGAASAAPMVAC